MNSIEETKGKITYNDIPYDEIVSLYNYVLPKNRKSCECVPNDKAANWCKDNNVEYHSGIAGVIHYIMKLENDIEQLKNI